MATITIKRKKPASAEAPAEGGREETVATMGGPAPVSAGLVDSKGPSYTIEAICSILAVLCFVALLLLQWVELQDYNKPPAAFLQPGANLAS